MPCLLPTSFSVLVGQLIRRALIARYLDCLEDAYTVAGYEPPLPGEAGMPVAVLESAFGEDQTFIQRSRLPLLLLIAQARSDLFAGADTEFLEDAGHVMVYRALRNE